MNKIPTLFVRDSDNRARVVNFVTPGCEWVGQGVGVASRKYDGTCTMLDEDGAWWARREVKPGKPAPAGYMPLSTDLVTGKTVGWEPIEQSSFAKYHTDALLGGWNGAPGTYELCGPKINGNPEGFSFHVLVKDGENRLMFAPRDFVGLRALLLNMPDGFEGLVWAAPDGRMAKLKRRDFA